MRYTSSKSGSTHIVSRTFSLTHIFLSESQTCLACSLIHANTFVKGQKVTLEAHAAEAWASAALQPSPNSKRSPVPYTSSTVHCPDPPVSDFGAPDARRSPVRQSGKLKTDDDAYSPRWIRYQSQARDLVFKMWQERSSKMVSVEGEWENRTVVDACFAFLRPFALTFFVFCVSSSLFLRMPLMEIITKRYMDFLHIPVGSFHRQSQWKLTLSIWTMANALGVNVGSGFPPERLFLGLLGSDILQCVRLPLTGGKPKLVKIRIFQVHLPCLPVSSAEPTYYWTVQLIWVSFSFLILKFKIKQTRCETLKIAKTHNLLCLLLVLSCFW